MSMTDVWDGFANLLAELIEKHVAELSFDDIPTSNNDSNDRSNEHTDAELTVDKLDSA